MHQSGMVGDAQWRQTRNAYTHFMLQPGFRVGYRIYRQLSETSPALDVLDEILRQSEGREQPDFGLAWDTLMKMELEAIDDRKANLPSEQTPNGDDI